MTNSTNVAIIGGTNPLCETLLDILHERKFPAAKIDVFDDVEHEGDEVPFGRRTVSLKSLADLNVAEFNIIFNFRQDFYAQIQANLPATTYLIDFSSLHEAGADANREGFIVPEVNPQQLDAGNIVHTPHAAAIAASMIINKLGIDLAQVHLHVMQPVSIYGKAAMDELANQTTQLLNARPLETNFFKQQIAFNVLTTDGYEGEASREENNIAAALKQIYPGEYTLNVSVVTVSAFYGVSMNMTIQAYEPIAIASVYDALANNDTFEVAEHDSKETQPSAIADANGTDKIYISRIRLNNVDQNVINMWCVLDNGRKGSTLNGVQTAEILVKSYL